LIVFQIILIHFNTSRVTPACLNRSLIQNYSFVFLSYVQQQRYDLALQMQGNGSIVNPMVESFGAKFTAGFYLKDDYCPDPNLFLVYPDRIHEIERHLKLMEYLGISSCGSELEFPLTGKDQQEFDDLNLPIQAGKYICIHAGSRGGWRQWPVEYFAKIADHCAAKGFTIVLTGTRDEVEIVKSVENNMRSKPLIAAGKTSIGAAGVLIKNAFALISNCTGVSHMAAAFKTPSVVISMDGEPERWAPLNKELHKTIDWTKNHQYDLVLEQVEGMISDRRQHVTSISA